MLWRAASVNYKDGNVAGVCNECSIVFVVFGLECHLFCVGRSGYWLYECGSITVANSSTSYGNYFWFTCCKLHVIILTLNDLGACGK